jgi:predicted phosphodiesterase
MAAKSFLKDPKWVEAFVEAWNNTSKYPSKVDVALALGIDRNIPSKYYRILVQQGRKDLVDRGVTVPPTIQHSSTEQASPAEQFGEALQVRRLKDELTRVKSDLREAEKRALTSEVLMEIIHGASSARFDHPADWLTDSKQQKLHGIPTLMISDVHFDEYVDPAQIGYVNEYNREIAVHRIQHTFQESARVLQSMARASYDGINVCLGGDLLSGNIHEELAETNEAPILASVIKLTELLHQGIQLLVDQFGRVDVQCVVGNHGRLHKKPRAKNRVFDNYEWLIYQHLAKSFAGDPRVNFVIPDGPDCVFKVYNQTFLLTHGDQFKGGSGISGIFTPLHLGLHRKQSKQAAIHASFDVMLLGHFHQYIHTNNIVVNGSIKGYDEWTNLQNFSFQRPMQALWVNHPEHGMVLRTPILCDSYAGGYLTPEEMMIRMRTAKGRR